MARSDDTTLQTERLPGSDGAPQGAAPGPGEPGSGPPDGGRTVILPVLRGDRRRGVWGIVAIVLLAAALLLSLKAVSWFGGIDNPFGQRTKDRTGPVVLESIQDLARFEAATGNFQVVVDLEKDTKYVPSALSGERTLFIGAGTVNAYVDFAGLKDADLKMSGDRTRAEIALPAPALERPNLDPERSYVFAQERGAIDRFRSLFDDDPNRLQELYKAASAKIADAARETKLVERAEANTRAMLAGLLRSLGFTSVTVTFAGA